MKKIVTLFIVLALLILSFRAGQKSDNFMQFMQHNPVNGEALDKTISVDGDIDMVAQTLFQQASAWNNGDIDTFMADYWRSDSLRFASGSMVKYGWQTTLDRYKERYPDDAAMGELVFSDLDIQMLSGTDALVFGRWQLKRQTDTPNGLFTLHMRKVNNRWVIVSDHTSSSN